MWHPKRIASIDFGQSDSGLESILALDAKYVRQPIQLRRFVPISLIRMTSTRPRGAHLVPDGPITRRQLIRAGAGLAGLVVVGLAPGRADAADCGPCPTMTVWHLETQWSQPRGPHGKTRLVSRASRRAAQHRFALTEADALDMNLHLCSWAPAASIEVCAEAFMGLWDEVAYEWHNPWLNKQVRILDIRHVAALSDGEERLAHALSETEIESGFCPSANVGGMVSAGGAGGVVSALPFTGISALGPALSGAGLVLTGLVALRVAREGKATQDTSVE